MRCAPDQAHKKSVGGSFARVPLWVSIHFEWSLVVRVGGVLYFIFLGGVLFYTHYLRWSLFLSRFRIIILKERGPATGFHHGSEKLICARSLWGRGAGKMETAAQNEGYM